MTELEAMCLLVSARGVGYAQRSAALLAAGSAENVLADPFAFERALGGEGARAVRSALLHAEEILGALEAAGVTALMPGMDGWSERLSQIARPPHLLFCRGAARLNDAFPFAIVGTRRADEYGLRHARRIAGGVASAGVCVVSGLALGIDAAAHVGALDASGRTIAVLGSAHDVFFPEENRPLMERILENGGTVVTEYPLGTPPDRYSFLMRNRLIAGLSLGVLVVEGAARSGASRTAHDALDAGREVFALPGSVDSELSRLPNRLIAEGAHVAVCASDILGALVIDKPADWKEAAADKPSGRAAASSRTATAGRKSSRKRGTRGREAQKAEEAGESGQARTMPPELEERAQAVWRILEAEETDFDALCVKTGLAGDEIGALLMEMEMEGHIESVPGLRYRLAR